MLSEKNTFQKSSMVFYSPRRPPPPPGLAKDHKKYVFFRHPSLTTKPGEERTIASAETLTLATYMYAWDREAAFY